MMSRTSYSKLVALSRRKAKVDCIDGEVDVIAQDIRRISSLSIEDSETLERILRAFSSRRNGMQYCPVRIMNQFFLSNNVCIFIIIFAGNVRYMCCVVTLYGRRNNLLDFIYNC